MSIETWATCGAQIQYDNANSCCFNEVRSDPLDKELPQYIVQCHIRAHTHARTITFCAMVEDKTAQKL